MARVSLEDIRQNILESEAENENVIPSLLVANIKYISDAETWVIFEFPDASSEPVSYAVSVKQPLRPDTVARILDQAHVQLLHYLTEIAKLAHAEIPKSSDS